jgi:EAL domain-containing protein (putative c-di-GMP-specific phosphodiesterase class I)
LPEHKGAPSDGARTDDEGASGSTLERPSPDRILVVDDEPAVLLVFERILTSAGYEVVACSTVVEALSMVMSVFFDAILSDVSMPGLSGLDFIKAVRARDVDVPVLLVTGQPVHDPATAALEHGALQYLTKPIEPTALRASVHRACTLHKLAIAKRQAQALQQWEPRELSSTFDCALETLYLALQPVLGRDRRIVGYEALLRSREPALATPRAFVSAAEQLQRLDCLGRAVRGAAALALLRFPSEATLFLNIHSHDLADDALHDDTEPLNPHADRVVLEIADRTSLAELKDLPAQAASLRSRGFRLAVDDLGVGYAGLTSVAVLEPEFVKLDATLIRNVHLSPVTQSVIGRMNELFHQLGSQVVAEGVETSEEHEQLLTLGCDLFQGYLFARPTEYQRTLADDDES